MLCAVFVPSAFITGISGQFYRAFALTIAGATVISLIVSLTLSPAMCALLLKPHKRSDEDRWWERPIHGFFRCSIAASTRLADGYGWLAGASVRIAVLMLVAYVGVLAFGLNEFRKTPIGFIPQVDRGFLIIVVQLPPGASLSRTDAVMRARVEIAWRRAGRRPCDRIVGFYGASFTNAPNSGAIFLVLDEFEKRARDPHQSAGGDPGRAVRQICRDPGSADLRRAAAAGAGHRQCRRLPHDGRGPRRPRARRRCRRRSTR